MQHWGISTHIDLKVCQSDKIIHKEAIEHYVIALCDLMEVKRYGDPTIVRFGARPEIAGFSLVQLIETSCVTGHFVDSDHSAYIDVFSCNAYDVQAVVDFTRRYFDCQEFSYSILSRK